MKRFLIALLLLSPPAMGQAPTPTPEPSPVVNPLPKAAVVASPSGPVPAGTLVTLDASETVGDDLDWDSDADEKTFQVDTGKRKLYFSTPAPGSYPFKVEAFGIVGGKVKVNKAKVTIVVLPPPTPPPVNPPGPTPTPTPTPTPVPSTPTLTGHLHVSLFYDVNDVSVAAFRSSATLRADLAAIDCDWYMAATTSPAAQPFNGELSADGTPVVLVQDAAFRLVKDPAGKTLAIKDFKSPADLLAKIKALRGAN